MGNTSPSCFSRSNTNAGSPPADGFPSIFASDSGQPSETHESSSVHAMEYIRSRIQEDNTTEHIDRLIEMMERCLSKIKVREEDVSASSDEGLLASATRCASQVVEFVSTEAKKNSIKVREDVSASCGVGLLASATRCASQVVEFVSTEAKKNSIKDRMFQVESVATRVLSTIGSTHYIFLGLSLVAYTLENYLTMKSNESTCMDLLEELINLARQVKDFKEAVPEKCEDVHKAIHSIVVEAVTCRKYIAENSRHRLAP